MKKPIRILFVEDDPNLSILVNDYLSMHGYQVIHAENGEDGLKSFLRYDFQMAILDVMLPKVDGFQLATQIRELNKKVPIIFLTARSLKDDRIKGFRTGADDYITKPFSTEELALRIEAILKRCLIIEEEETEETFLIGSFFFDYPNLILQHSSGDRKLTRKEADLLKLLAEHKNNLLTRELALKSVWGDDDYFTGRSMDVFITKLRKYLKPDPGIAITNVHGTGFRLEEKST